MSDAPRHNDDEGLRGVAAERGFTTRLQLGVMRGEFSWEEGWDCALTNDEADAFWEGR